MKNSIVKSPIKWAGGKGFLVSRILNEFRNSDCETFIDLFTGSGIVALNVDEGVKVLAYDVNKPLITFHRIVSEKRFINLEYNLTEEEYYLNRKRFNEIKEEETLEVAQLFYYLNRAGFNGLYRENKKGEFNVPWGKRKKILPLEVVYPPIHFLNSNYKDIEIPENSFVYLDPPYDGTFSTYNKEGFSKEDQIHLIDWILGKKCKFLISNSDTPFIKDLYESRGLNLDYVEAPRRISANGNRSKVLEVLAKKL